MSVFLIKISSNFCALSLFFYISLFVNNYSMKIDERKPLLEEVIVDNNRMTYMQNEMIEVHKNLKKLYF